MNKKAKFRSSSEWKKKRKEIMKRDNFKCKLCGKEEGLQCHHVYSLNTNWEKRLENNNIITVCKDCHSDIHNNKYSEYYLLQQITK